MAVRDRDVEVIGRDDELSVGRAFLGAAAHRLAVMAVEGPAGMGKTTIWSALVEDARARAFTVLACRPAEAEATYTYAAVRDLLEQVPRGATDALPGPQREALAALSVAADPSQPLSEHLVAAALRSLVLVLAQDRPVLVAIDDIQWLDAASAAVVAFAARRLRTEPVGLLTARRTGLATPLALDRLDAATQSRVVVGPLSLAALHHVVIQRTGASLPRMTLARVHAAADGNPLFALEIARVIHEHGVPDPGEPLPVPTDVHSMLEARVAAVRGTSEALLLLAAAARRPTTAILAAALQRDVEADVRAATSAGILVPRGAEELAFAHPLLADAVLSRASAVQRNEAHRRLAAVARDTEERARHLALSTAGADEMVAAALEDAASHADRRGAPAAAAELLEMAIARTPPDQEERIVRRRLAIGAAVLRSGDPVRASVLLRDLVERTPPGSRRAEARLLHASVLMATDTQQAANDEVLRAIEDARDDPAILARAHATAARLVADGEAHARIAIELLDRMPEPDVVALTHAYVGLGAAAMNRGGPIPPDLVERALAMEERVKLPSVSERFTAAYATWLKYLDDFEAARKLLRQVHRECLDEGDEESLVFAYAHLPQLELWTGNTTAAEDAARRHLELAEAVNEESQRRQAIYNLANVLAQQGRETEARTLLTDGLRAAREDDDPWTEALLLPVLGMLELSLGHAEEAVHALAPTASLRARARMPGPGRHLPALIEALVATGRLAEASATLADFGRRAGPDGRASALAGLHRASAIVAAAHGNLDEAIQAIDAALREHDRAPMPFERAWTLLVGGRIRRRRRERSAARAAFEAALDGFTAVDARLWVARTEEELARTGIRSAPSDLTRTERRVAELVASGMTNREVAAALFISPKTVDANLGRVYRKLGVASRAELGARMQTLQT